ncbi:MAG: response regulator [Candidatus Wallbacteria bacterium]|nr:response regulator [Candidatus Wallbacteria bacterium]
MRTSVLIVDDSLTVRMDLAEVFERAGMDTTLCASIQQAREAVAAGAFELIVLDVLLPDGDGLAFLQELRAAEKTRALPVMLLSTESEVAARIRGLESGADEYLGKPYEPAQVISRARQLVRRRPSWPEGLRPPTVLVIDDSQSVRQELRLSLEGAGYRVLLAASGEEGLRTAADTRPDAIIVDSELPGISGTTVVRNVRLDAGLRTTPCLLLTGSAGSEAEADALEAGADDFARKGGDMELLLTRLRRLVRPGRGQPLSGPTPSLESPKRILAVDDSPTFLHELASELQREGYEIVSARSGEEALELLAAQSVDAILLDLRMPGLDGHEVCRRVKSQAALRDVPLLMLTAAEEREAMIEGIDAGADDYINKSADFEVLKARLRAQLRRKQFEDETRRIREELVQKALEAAEARSATRLAETRAAFLANVEQKNEDLARLNAQYLRAKEQAERESLFKSRFLASMSHELRTPLNAIIGFSELLIDDAVGPLDEAQRDYMQNVLSSGRHLLNLINEVLDISKIEAGKTELRCEWVPIDAVVNAVKASAMALSQRRRITVEYTLPDQQVSIFADPVRLKQVLYNLLSNGIKFTPDGGRVSLEVRAEPERVYISVDDTGIGIRPEDLSRLFREFERLEDRPSDPTEGTGLGLALTKKLVELHGGSIAAESQPGKGSRFTVMLPVFLRQEVDWTRQLKRDGPGEKPLVLVVEDDPKAADLIAGHLRSAGFGIEFAAHAEEAVKLAIELTPIAVTLDIMMPGTDGWTVLRRLKSQPETAAIPVVVISVLDQPSQGYLLGATDYLVKPITREQILQSFNSLGLIGSEFWHEATGLPSAAALQMHVRTRIQQAERELKRFAVVGFALDVPSRPAPIPWARLLRPALRPGDLMAVAGDGALALVSYGLRDGDVPVLTERMSDLITASMETQVRSSAAVWYPDDGSHPEELLEKLCQRIGTERSR